MNRIEDRRIDDRAIERIRVCFLNIPKMSPSNPGMPTKIGTIGVLSHKNLTEYPPIIAFKYSGKWVGRYCKENQKPDPIRAVGFSGPFACHSQREYTRKLVPAIAIHMNIINASLDFSLLLLFVRNDK